MTATEAEQSRDFLAQRYVALVAKLSAVAALLPQWDDEIVNGHGSRRDGLRKAHRDLAAALGSESRWSS